MNPACRTLFPYKRLDFYNWKLCQLHSDLIKHEVRGYFSFGLATFLEGCTKTQRLSVASTTCFHFNSEALSVFDVQQDIGLQEKNFMLILNDSSSHAEAYKRVI